MVVQKRLKELGIRAVLVPYVAEHPDHNYFETLKSNEALLNRWHQSAQGRIEGVGGARAFILCTTSLDWHTKALSGLSNGISYP